MKILNKAVVYTLVWLTFLITCSRTRSEEQAEDTVNWFSPSAFYAVLEEQSQTISNNLDAASTRRRTCGTRCCFVFLKMKGWNGTFEEVDQLIPIGPYGASMADMESAIDQFGHNVQAVRSAPEELKNIPLPAIAHLESSSDTNHYVILLDYNDEHAVIFDPNISSGLVQSIPTSFSQLCTGYFLIPEQNLIPVWLRNVLILTGFVICIASLKRRNPLKRLGLLLCFSTSICMHSGCSSEVDAVSNQPTQKKEVNAEKNLSEKNLLQVESTEQDLGIQKLGDPAEGTFSVTNVSDRTLKMKLGPSSCMCLAALLDPKGGSVAPGAKASVTLKLNLTYRSNAGPVSGKVPLFIEGTREHYVFRLAAIAEGLAELSTPYVIRPAQTTNSSLPLLKFAMITQSPDTPFEIHRIVAYRRPDFLAQVKTLDKPDDPAIPEPFPEIVAEIEKLETRPAYRLGIQSAFRRNISVPISLSDCMRPVSGFFEIHYSVRGEARPPAKVKLALLAN